MAKRTLGRNSSLMLLFGVASRFVSLFRLHYLRDKTLECSSRTFESVA
jgi:hypothetical protein